MLVHLPLFKNAPCEIKQKTLKKVEKTIKTIKPISMFLFEHRDDKEPIFLKVAPTRNETIAQKFV